MGPVSSLDPYRREPGIMVRKDMVMKAESKGMYFEDREGPTD